MGAGDVFDQGKADIPGVAEIEPVWVSEVLHKVWIDVNEKGTEAAAVTAVMVAIGIDDIEPPVPEVFRADSALGVPGLMRDLEILTLEIQRMSKNPATEFLAEKEKKF